MLRKIEPAAAQVEISARTSFYEHIKKMWLYRRALLSISIASGFSYACYALSLVMTTGLVPMVTTCTLADMIKLNAFLLVIDFLLLPLFGLLAGKYSRHTMMLIASLAVIVMALPSFAIMQGASLSLIVAIRLIFVVVGVAFAAPFHAWAQGQVPSDARYTVVSFADALGSQIFGAPAAFVSLWLYEKTGMLFLAGSYWCLMAMVTFAWMYFEEVYLKKKVLI
jgi:MHS family proline/betaine transporter-like MFS transporter